MDIRATSLRLKDRARSLGFELVGVCPAVSASGWDRLQEWLASGYAGQMDYLANRVSAYEHPRHVLEGVRSLVMLGDRYQSASPQPVEPGQGRVSRYAWGSLDYHDVLHERLRELRGYYLTLVPDGKARGVVDTAPLLEREFAQLAGLGWIGKNTLLLNKQLGSWFFLAALLVDQELDYDQPHHAQHCGTCRACLDACPTQAFPEPYVLDATKCISYLTIEVKGRIATELRSGLGDWVFGCDVCQDVCPWNRKPLPDESTTYAPASDMNPISLPELFWLSDDDFRRRFRATPLWRPRRRGLLRNAAIVLGNQRADHASASLTHGLNDAEPLVRAACAWALGQLRSPGAAATLRTRRLIEKDTEVLQEIELALEELQAMAQKRKQ